MNIILMSGILSPYAMLNVHAHFEVEINMPRAFMNMSMSEADDECKQLDAYATKQFNTKSFMLYEENPIVVLPKKRKPRPHVRPLPAAKGVGGGSKEVMMTGYGATVPRPSAPTTTTTTTTSSSSSSSSTPGRVTFHPSLLQPALPHHHQMQVMQSQSQSQPLHPMQLLSSTTLTTTTLTTTLMAVKHPDQFFGYLFEDNEVILPMK